MGGIAREEPKLVKVWIGWAAVGDGWAVYARTRTEAVRLFQARAREYEAKPEEFVQHAFVPFELPDPLPSDPAEPD